MIPYILAAVGGYLIGDSVKGKQYARGGKMPDEIKSGDLVHIPAINKTGVVSGILRKWYGSDNNVFVAFPDGSKIFVDIKELEKLDDFDNWDRIHGRLKKKSRNKKINNWLQERERFNIQN